MRHASTQSGGAESSGVEAGPDGHIQSLARGLDILRMLVDETRPLTGTEIARRCGLHQSSVSRILATLSGAGYVKRVTGGFGPDYGVLYFAQALHAFPVVTSTKSVLEGLAAEYPGFYTNLCLLWRGELIYLVRSMANTVTVTGWAFTLHESSAAMRLLADMPDEEALGLLEQSRARHGWRGGGALPTTPETALQWARDHVAHDVLVLDSWSGRSVSGAIPVRSASEHPLVVALAGPPGTDPQTLRFALHDARRRVETALSTTKAKELR